jgi:hypothetical protein
MAETSLLPRRFSLVHLIDLLVTLLKKLTAVIKPGSGCFTFMDWHRLSFMEFFPSHIILTFASLCVQCASFINTTSVLMTCNWLAILNHLFKNLKLFIINEEWAAYIFVDKVFMLYYTSHPKLRELAHQYVRHSGPWSAPSEI